MFISKELVVYSLKKKRNCFLLFLSLSQGWGINKVYSGLIPGNTRFKLVIFSKVKWAFISNLFLGFFRNYFYFLKLKGMGFKMLSHTIGIILKLGCSHRLLFIRQKEIALTYLSRHLLKIEGRSLTLLKTILFQLMKLRIRSVYKKKGIFLKGSILRFKVTSKKSKF